MTSAAFFSFVQGLLLLASALIVIRLYTTGLYRKYRYFFAYFIFRILNGLSSLVLDLRSDMYQYVWVCVLPIVLTFYILLVVELYRLVLERYKGLQTVGRWAMYVSLAGSLAISMLTLIPTIQPSLPQRSKIMRIALPSERVIETALAVFILLLLALLSRYPIQLSRNVRTHAIIYSIFFFTNTLGALARTVLGLRLALPVMMASSVATLLSLIAWLVLLRPEGEWQPDSKAYVSNEHERRLLLQLDGLNAALLRVSSKN